MKKKAKITYIAILTLFILALAFFAMEGFEDRRLSPQGEIVGKNTFRQTMVQADGVTVEFFASGDQYFNYLHDKDGYILLRHNGYLVYAKEKNGRPMPSSVKYTDSREKIDALDKMVYSDIDFSLNPDLITEYPEQQSSALYQSAQSHQPIINIVIFICFAGETVNLDRQLIDGYLNGSENSLADYYYKLSYGKINVESVYPQTSGDNIYVYQDSNPRSYYQLKEGASNRARRESQLLNSAVAASRYYFDLQGLDIDTDNDGFVDSVNFLISGTPYSSWGGMLWPHSWDLYDISNGNSQTINGLRVRKYSFNFLEQLTVGLLAHEFAHVLGVPDLYHYNDSHAAVGNWDLMHYEADIPQFMTTHLRYKYLNVVNDCQIGIVEYNGVYSLKPVTAASPHDIVAYRINTDKSDEYFMVEFRNNNIAGYDASLPGAGLIIYRIKQGVYGNSEALKHNAQKPDEVYIFRPNVVTTGSEATKSLGNLNKAYLSPHNPDFYKVGSSLQQKPNSYFDSDTLYYTNGRNSGISIEAIAINDDQIIFEVKLSGVDNVDNNYFLNKLSIENAKLNNDSQFSGVYADLNVSDINLSYLKSLYATLKSQSGNEITVVHLDRNKFVEAYQSGLRSFAVRFVVNRKGSSLISVFYDAQWNNFNEPATMELYAVDSDNDNIKIGEYDINKSYASWASIEMTGMAYKPSVDASMTSTVIVKKDGRAVVSSVNPSLDRLSIEGVISASIGAYHLLCVKSDLKVWAYGNMNQGENNVGDWTNIIKAVAGEHTSYGLDYKGNVYCAGQNALTGVNEWRDIIDISAGEKHIVGLQANGRVLALGNNEYQQCQVSEWTDIVAIAAGHKFTAGLKKNGKVVIAGELSDAYLAQGWSDIKKIAAGENHLLAIDGGGKVYAAGENFHGQCNVQDIYDIIQIAAGKDHSVMLREDGEIIYAGHIEHDLLDDNLIYINDDYVEVTSITSPFDKKILKIGQTYQLNPTVLPYNATYKKMTYSSGNPEKVSVTADGLITALQVGTAVITGRHRGSELKITVEITVQEPINTKAMIAAGDKHSVILDNSGTVYSSGSNDYGQLDVNMWGNVVFVAAGGNTTIGITPENKLLVAGEMAGMGAEQWTDIVFAATSGNAIVGITQSGLCKAIGDNDYGQVTDISRWTDIKAVALSSTHIVALKEDGTVIAFGNNSSGQTEVGHWRKVAQIAAGEGFSLGLTEEGEVLYAGASPYVQDMTIIEGWKDIVYIAAGPYHIAAVDFDGNVYAVGNNSHGQTDAGGLENIGLIACGGAHTVGIDFYGVTAGIGRNYDGRLHLPDVNELPYIELNDITFEEKSYSDDVIFGVKIGEKRKLNPVFNPFNATDRKSQNITYISDAPAIASVDQRGFITGMSAGSAVVTMTVRGKNGEQKTASIQVRVYSNAISVSIAQQPFKTVYRYGERLSLLGGRAIVRISSETSYSKKITKDMIENYDTVTNAYGNVMVKVRDGQAFAKYEITVVNVTLSIEITDISNLKTIYYYGEEIDLGGGWVTRTLADGSKLDAQTMQSLDDGKGSLEIIADTHILASTFVTLKYTDPIALEAGIVNVIYISFEIAVFDKVIGITPNLSKSVFAYGEEIFGNGELIIKMQSGADIIEPIIRKTDIEDGEDSVIVIEGYDKYVLGAQNVKFRYYNPDFDIPLSLYPQVSVTVEDSVSHLIVTSMMLNDAAVYDSNKHYDQSILARVSFYGGAVIDVGNVDGQPLFENIHLGFDDYQQGDGFENINMHVWVKNTLGGYSKLYTVVQKVFGLSSVKELQLIGQSSFKYGEETDLRLWIKDGNDTEYTIEIDDWVLGVDNTLLTPQTISFTLMGKTAQKTIQFFDYVTGIYTRQLNITVIVGQEYNQIPLDVYCVMASGAEQTVQNWTMSNYDKNKLGTQYVTVNYTFNYEQFHYNITVNVIDVIDEIRVLSSPKTLYEVYQDLDLSDFSIRLIFRQSTPQDIHYNEEDFAVTGYDKTKIGVQNITVTYIVTGDFWTYQVEVRNKIQRIVVDYEKSKLIYALGEPLSIVMYCEYVNGEQSLITDSFIHDFDSTKIGVQQINISYWGTYSVTLIVEVIDIPVEIQLIAPAKKYYDYGQTLDLSGGKVILTTKSGTKKTLSISAYEDYLTPFNPTPSKGEAQVIFLNLTQFGLSTSFKVYVREKNASPLLVLNEGVQGVKIDRINTRIIFDEGTIFAEFMDKVNSYADILCKKKDGSYMDIVYDQNMFLNSDISIEIRNSEGALLEAFSVYVKGDADKNGILDQNDIPLLAQALLQNTSNAAIYADYNGDGVYTLTDFVLWTQKAKQLQ